MTIEQTRLRETLDEKLVMLQNKCNRAQGALVHAEEATSEEEADHWLKEAQLELE